MSKMKVGIIGATGMVGQNYIRLLENHPWFEVGFVAASPRSAGKRYVEAVENRWLMDSAIPREVRNLVVRDAADIRDARRHCSFIFSAVDMPKEQVRALENSYAENDLPVVSNNSAHRRTVDVPVLIPEINPGHLELIAIQRRRHGWGKGFIVVKPNCSVQSYMIPVHALQQAGYLVEEMIITTLQGVSGSGYPGVASLDIVDNIVPYIGGEEEKSEIEPLKIFGEMIAGELKPATAPAISAHCNRVPVIDGHTACVSLRFRDQKPEFEEILKVWREFSALPQELQLPMAPVQPVIYRGEQDRPQPRKDRNNGKAMAVTVGRLRKCQVFDYRFVGLSHNTVRGAAGGGILKAELLQAKGFFD